MTGKSVGLSDYLKELERAAGAGAARIASSVTASGNVQAKAGITVDVPGPALSSLLAGNKPRSSRTADAVAPDRIPRIADRMAKDALRQGAALLSGKS